jgi:hypothetical protein
MLIAVLLMLLAMMSGCATPGTLRPGKIRFAYHDRDGGIRIITGTGRQVAEFHSCEQPDVHPSQDRVICRRPQRPSTGDVTSNGNKANWELVELSLQSQEPAVRVRYRAPATERIRSPVWSPEGKRVAFVVGEDIGILDVEGDAFQRLRAEKSVSEIWWSPDGTRLYLDGQGMCDIGELDLDSGTYRRLGLWKDHRNPLQGLPADWPADPVFYRNTVGCPKLPPRLTPGGQYYFRQRERDGWFAKGWIERCNTRTHYFFCTPIRTEWRALFRE